MADQIKSDVRLAGDFRRRRHGRVFCFHVDGLVLEMWWFDKAFVNAQGERRVQWSVYLEGKFREAGGEKAAQRLAEAGKELLLYSRDQFVTHGWPLLKSWLHKLTTKK